MGYPERLICPECENGEECTSDLEHNPYQGYEHHLYGCDCDECLRWYRTFK